MPRPIESPPNEAGEIRIALTQGKVAVIDAADWGLVKGHSWYAVKCANGLWYAQTKTGFRRGHQRPIFMHRLLMGNPPRLLIDHRNHDGLCNRRSNIRLTNHTGNACNSRRAVGVSGFRGVTVCKKTGRWHAKIKVNRKTRHVGYFDTPEAAARARDAAAAEWHGEFARFNFPAEETSAIS